MNFIKVSISILSGVLLLALASCATSTDPAESYPGQSAEQIFQKGEDALRDRDYGEAIKRYEALDVQYPFGHNTELAQLHIIYAYYMNNDYTSATSAAERFIHTHPDSPHVDYAYFMRGLSNFYQNLGILERLFALNLSTRDLTQIKKSYNDFASLIQHYPNSKYAPAAHQYMVYLRNIIADHQLQVANYYYQRQAYVAAADRANIVVRHYQGTPSVPGALVVMTKSYRRMHLTQLADDSMLVLKANYPGTDYIKEAQK